MWHLETDSRCNENQSTQKGHNSVNIVSVYCRVVEAGALPQLFRITFAC